MNEYFCGHPDLSSRALGGTTVVFNPHTGTVYDLNTVGTFIWDLLQEKQTLETLSRQTQGRFGISYEKASHDVRDFILTLVAKGLVVRSLSSEQ